MLAAIDAIILGKLYDRPIWAKSLKLVKARVHQLVLAGYVERVAPPGSANPRWRNMLTLTPQGVDAIEAHWNAELESRAT